MVYFYRQYRYENLVDALNYARIGCMHAGKDTLQVPVLHAHSLVNSGYHMRYRMSCCPVSARESFI